MVEVYTLGKFVFKINGKRFTQNSGKTHKLWKLLNLFVINRGRPTSVESIYEAIWPNGPHELKAVHNLVFRLRHIFMEENGRDSHECVKFSHNGYILNLKEDSYVDAYEMHDCFQAAKATADRGEKIKHLDRIFEIYDGEYLQNAYDEPWAMLVVSQYKRMYIEAINMLLDIYLEECSYDDLARICEKAIKLEPFEESIYERKIMGMQFQGQTHQAIALCEKYFDLIYRTMGLRASEQMNKLYRRIRGEFGNQTQSLELILDGFTETDRQDLAFSCDIDMFKKIYQHTLRLSNRSNEPASVILLSIIENSELPKNIVSSAVSLLYNSCLKVLRCGDVVTHYSPTQVMILVSQSTPESKKSIERRIRNHFYSIFNNSSINLNFDTQPVISL